MSDKVQHQIIEAEGYITVKLTGELSADTADAFLADLPKMVRPTHHVVLQCENLSGIQPQWVRPLMTLELELRKLNKKVRLIQASSRVTTFLQAQGVEKALKAVPTLRDALVDFGLATKKAIDMDFINPFLSAAMTVLKVQANTESYAEKPHLKQPGEKFSGDISGVIGIVSPAFNGSVVISFPEATFLEIMSRMFGEKQTTLTKEIEDGAGELTNIIFGQAKIALNEKGYGIQTALPSVITGKDHSVQSTVKGITVTIPFNSDSGQFFIEICTSI